MVNPFVDWAKGGNSRVNSSAAVNPEADSTGSGGNPCVDSSSTVDPDVDSTKKGNLSRSIAAVRQDDVQWH